MAKAFISLEKCGSRPSHGGGDEPSESIRRHAKSKGVSLSFCIQITVPPPSQLLKCCHPLVNQITLDFCILLFVSSFISASFFFSVRYK